MKSFEHTILIADDEEKIRKVLKINLKNRYRVILAQNGSEAIEYLKNEAVHLVLTDLRMPEQGGLDLLQYVQRYHKHIPVIIVTAFGSIENAVQAMKMGAYDYILKPIKIAELQRLIEKALHYAQLLSENVQLKERLKKYEGFREIITVNPKMQALLEILKQVAATPATVLIEGESGTGKQLVAASVHYMSARADNPFIEINCGAIPATLLESELFGHEKGAFTGAIHTKKGKFELADKGTLFLDEIGELPLELQVKLLHVLENQKFTRVGGTQYIKTNARIVAATNRKLIEEVEKKRFRSDLYYRLKVVYLQIPPLRERKEDIPLLVQSFTEKYSRLNANGQRNIEISDEALNVLQSYNWPGNVRELENIIQQAIIFAKDGLITADTLPPEILENAIKPSLTKAELQDEKNRRTETIIRDIECSFLKRILSKTRGNITRAAEISGYDRRQIQNLTKKHDINTENFK
ncbi:MAG: sigma-54-dependent Fis family transcriptional regulator [Deltaproteobacteria bacterium]|nr:sigma-54-dependent Fis family transcriptional regulator [Deltaproteobacteria bacterium]